MPTYDYVCTACGHRVEVVHGIHGNGPTTCAVCGGRLRKAVTAPAVHYKGSGWAKKDRRATVSTRAAAKAEAGGDGASEASTKAGDDAASSASNKSGDDGAAAGPDNGAGAARDKGSKTTTKADAPATKSAPSSSAEAD
ncbi:MAG: hypothetical protein QOF11_573 [Chloroflexota bacterium]|jgi:putative FmdB family regulatory protein|nr:hypothetical protein [Chloroflexota bacterium]